jgi:hypothetical protein
MIFVNIKRGHVNTDFFMLSYLNVEIFTLNNIKKIILITLFFKFQYIISKFN